MVWRVGVDPSFLGAGQNPARQEFPTYSVRSTLVNMLCGSGDCVQSCSPCRSSRRATLTLSSLAGRRAWVRWEENIGATVLFLKFSLVFFCSCLTAGTCELPSSLVTSPCSILSAQRRTHGFICQYSHGDVLVGESVTCSAVRIN